MKRTTPNSPTKNPKPSKLRSTAGGLSGAGSRATNVPSPAHPKGSAKLQQHTPDASMLAPDDPDWQDEDVTEIPETDSDDAKRGRSRKNTGKDGGTSAAGKVTRNGKGKNSKSVDNNAYENEADSDADAPVEIEKPKRSRSRKNTGKDGGKSAAGKVTKNTGKSKSTKNTGDADENDEGESDVADSLVTKPKTVILKTSAFRDSRTLTDAFFNQLCQALKLSIINARVKESARTATSAQYELRSKYLKDLRHYEEQQDELGIVAGAWKRAIHRGYQK